MTTLRKIWNRYRTVINRNCTDESIEITSLSYWQNRLFSASVVYLIPLSLVAVIPGIYMAYTTGLKGMIAVDVFAIFTILAVAFIPGLSVFMRKLIFNGVLYVTSTMLLLYLGTAGPGLLYLLGITIFIVLSLDKKYAYAAVAMNTLICIAVGFMLYKGWGNFHILEENGLGNWIAVSSNLIFMSAVTVFLIPILFEGLQTTLSEERRLKSALEEKQDEMGRTLDELNSKNDELERFSYTVSHDLKEPLRMIRSFMELLERKYSPQLDEKATQYIHFAVDGSRRMTRSIDDLLEYSRIGRMYSSTEQVDVTSVLEEIRQLLASDIEKQQAKIVIGDLPEIQAVQVSVKMLFQNLVMNAMKYQTEGQSPEIEITCVDNGTHWKFAVKDNGIGIKEEHREEIFGIFRRLHAREEYPGNGMGLAICKKIVEQHGGKIWVESEVGEGSTFYFTIQK